MTERDAEKLKKAMKERDEDNGGEPLNAVDRGYHLACEHLYEEIDKLIDEQEPPTNEEREKAIDVLEHNWTRLVNADYSEEELNTAFNTALKALKQEPCEDAINRKELVEWLENIQPMDGKELGVLFDVREHVKKMQPVAPTREHGEWTDEVIEKQGNKLIECMTTEACKIAKGNIDKARKILAGKISEEEEKQLIFGADMKREQK